MRVAAAAAFWLFVLTMVGTLFAPVVFGLERYVIAGHSMTGTIPYGSVVYSRAVPASSLRVGNIITVVPPWDPDGKPVTHRLIKIGSVVNQAGKRQATFQTKGDFNRAQDPGPITLERAAVYDFHIPYVGLAFIYLSRFGLFVIGLPALIFGVLPIIRLWKASAPGAPVAPKPPQSGRWESLSRWGLATEYKYVRR